MLARLQLVSIEGSSFQPPVTAVRRALSVASDLFSSLTVEPGKTAEPMPNSQRLVQRQGRELVVSVLRWLDPMTDPAEIDEPADAAHTEGPFSLTLLIGAASVEEVALAAVQVVTRCQRFLPGHNQVSSCSLFERVLMAHQREHDLSKPLVRADYAHSIDAQRWVLRLDPEASLAVQLAALLHDVERLVTESDRRIEHHARDYVAFKSAHAVEGAKLAARILRKAQVPVSLARRVAELVRDHERPGNDPELTLLNEADALSFFSLNASGFVRYYGIRHTQIKVCYTLDRLGVRGRAQLSSIRHPALVRALLAHQQATEGASTTSSRVAV